MDRKQHSCRFAGCSIMVGLVLATNLSANDSINRAEATVQRNEVPPNFEYKFAPNNSTGNTTLKDILRLLKMEQTGLQSVVHGNPAAEKMSPEMLKSSLAVLLRMGNGTLNSSIMADTLRRENRGYGGGGYGGGGCCGGGFDPLLWMLLNRDDHPRQQQQQSNNDDFADLALLSLLALALIERMPTQG